MVREATAQSQQDDVQVFDIDEALSNRGRRGRVDLATSPNSYIAVFQTPPRKGEPHIHQHPDSDQILFVLQGECTVEGLSGEHVLKGNQGLLVPAGVHYGFINSGDEDLIFLSMRTESSGGRRVAYVPNVPSRARIRIPEEAFRGKALGAWLYVYAMDRRTIGISPLLMEEWNKGSLLRMNSEYQREDGHVLAILPERMTQWYQLHDLTESDYRIVQEPDETRVRVDLSPLIEREARGR